MKTVGYVRVSTASQASEGVSLDAQREKIRQYASLYDLELVGIEADEGASAKTLDRPGLQRALRMLRTKRADALLVVKLDRLTRSVRDLGDLIAEHFEKRSVLLSVADHVDTRTAAGRLVLNVMTSVAQWERETIGERTSVAMQHMRSRGEYTGGRVPYGYSLVGGELVRDEREQAVIETARALRSEGVSFGEISRRLADDRITNRAGRDFARMEIARMCA